MDDDDDYLFAGLSTGKLGLVPVRHKPVLAASLAATSPVKALPPPPPPPPYAASDDVARILGLLTPSNAPSTPSNAGNLATPSPSFTFPASDAKAVLLPPRERTLPLSLAERYTNPSPAASHQDTPHATPTRSRTRLSITSMPSIETSLPADEHSLKSSSDTSSGDDEGGAAFSSPPLNKPPRPHPSVAATHLTTAAMPIPTHTAAAATVAAAEQLQAAKQKAADAQLQKTEESLREVQSRVAEEEDKLRVLRTEIVSLTASQHELTALQQNASSLSRAAAGEIERLEATRRSLSVAQNAIAQRENEVAEAMQNIIAREMALAVLQRNSRAERRAIAQERSAGVAARREARLLLSEAVDGISAAGNCDDTSAVQQNIRACAAKLDEALQTWASAMSSHEAGGAPQTSIARSDRLTTTAARTGSAGFPKTNDVDAPVGRPGSLGEAVTATANGPFSSNTAVCVSSVLAAHHARMLSVAPHLGTGRLQVCK